MTWTAPEASRTPGTRTTGERRTLADLLTEGSLVAGERETLAGFLDNFRGSLLKKCAGLTGEQLAERTVGPSNLTLLGLVRHMAKVERTWFRERFAGQSFPPMYDVAKGKDADFEDLDPGRAGEDYDRLLEEIHLADEAIAGASLDDTFVHLGTAYSLRVVHVHMISEYARHVGHADLIRESLDGVTGS
ncbi:DinB family protein [Streptomyces sp. BE147]|uniref:DinB family protein n=1 Tax=Streptomyces sp. BE147 TaxID=3002524 RepID=UPI002E7611F9|nr:DinB family protein [Streptomyces sp. BE147]MEE1740361.1 DinB family protein [Streptomyces sp. BE147]